MAPKANTHPQTPPRGHTGKKDNADSQDYAEPPTDRSWIIKDYNRAKKSLSEDRDHIESTHHDPKRHQPHTWTNGINAYTNTSVPDFVFNQDASPRKPKPYGLRPHDTLDHDGIRGSTTVLVSEKTSLRLDQYRVKTSNTRSGRRKPPPTRSESPEVTVQQDSSDDEAGGGCCGCCGKKKKKPAKPDHQKQEPQNQQQQTQNQNQNKQRGRSPQNGRDEKDNDQRDRQQVQQNNSRQNQNRDQRRKKNAHGQNDQDDQDEKDRKDEPRYMHIPYQLPRERRVEFKPLEILNKKSKSTLNYDDVKTIRREVKQQREEQRKKRHDENYELVQRDWQDMKFDNLYELRLEADKKRLHFPVINYFGAFKKGARVAATEKAEPLGQLEEAAFEEYPEASPTWCS